MTKMRSVFRKASEIGCMLVHHGLNNPFSGNLSWRAKGGFWITISGSMKIGLGKKDFVFCTKAIPQNASMEAIVHKAVYENTGARAIIHAHPPCAIALSFEKKPINPVDAEGKYFLPKIPVLSLKNPVGSAESAAFVSKSLASNPCAMVRGHGIFAKGGNLEEAFRFVCVAESACRILLLKKALQGFPSK